MKSFKEFLIESVKLNEGGNALPDVVPIKQENALPTVEDIKKRIISKLGLTDSDIALLGSTGKKKPGDFSGDIDIALSAPKLLKKFKLHTYNDLIDKIIEVTKKEGLQYRDMRQIGIVSVRYPIKNEDGTQENQFVQVDFMLVEDVKYASWAYYSPSYLESKYKGLYANELMFFMARHAGLKPLKTDSTSGEVIEWERYFYDLSKGLLKGKQTRQGKRGLLKNPKTLEKNVVTTDIEEIKNMFFDSSVDIWEIRIFENLLKIMCDKKKFKLYDKRKKIAADAIKGILKKGYPVPQELEDIANGKCK